MHLVIKLCNSEIPGRFVLQILGICVAAGTFLAPILTNMYVAMLEDKIYFMQKQNIKWPEMFK